MSNKMLGIVNLEPANVHVEGIDDYRPVSATSFLGRYRILDFMISNMTNSHIDDIQIYIKNRPRSTIEHILGTNYNVNSKKGRFSILYGEIQGNNELYNTDIANFKANIEYIEQSTADYVVIAPSHFVYIEDFNEMLAYHEKMGADVTIMYQSVSTAKEDFAMCDILEFSEGKRVAAMSKNTGKFKNRDISLECYIMSRNLFIELIQKANATSSLFWLSDVVSDSLGDLKVVGYPHKGYVTCINSLKTYYKANLELRDRLDDLVTEGWPIYTKTNDTQPTLYRECARVSGSLIGNGCEIEGTVIDSVIGRNVVIKAGAVVKNAVIMPSVLINKNAKIENAVIDKYAMITHIKELKGTEDEPIYVKRRDRI